MRNVFQYTIAAIAFFGTASANAQSIGHSFFMRGSIVDSDSSGPVVCVGKSDGATVGQVLSVYRIVIHSSVPGKSVGPAYHRQLVGHVRIDRIFDEHFAHAAVADGAPAKHDIVELHKE